LKEVAYILFGAVFTVAVAIGLGSLLLRRLRVPLFREEAVLFAFVSGAAVLSLATFLLCILQLAFKGVFLVGGIAVFAGHAFARPEKTDQPRQAKACATWNFLFLVILAVFFILYFFNALAPEISPDGAGYHLANVARFWRHHGFVWDYHTMYAHFPQGVEMLFLVAFVFGHFSAAALVHLAFLLSLPLLIACYGRRYGFPRVGLFAAVLVYASPVAGKAGSSAYNDLAVATVVFAVFYLLQIWDEDRAPGLLILIGLLAGFAYSIKYTAALALPFAAGYLWWRMPRDRRLWRALAIFGSAAVIMVLPWILRNWIWLGDPFSPLLNRWFPNPYYHPGMEQSYLADVRIYTGLVHWWQKPWRALVSGELVGGMLGPIFLLTPLALLALRHSSGRRLLLAGLVFGLPALLNAQSRFLLPALPFVSLALGQALASPRGLLPILAVLHAIASLPPVVTLYANQYSWRLESLPVSAALRFEPEPGFLIEHITDYPLQYVLETKTPSDAKIFSLSVEESAYINRSLSPWYESVPGNLGMDLFSIPLTTDNQPSASVRFEFAPTTIRRLRVVETASANSYWTIAEMRVFSQGREVPRSPLWKLIAQPNRWEADLAFDNNYASRWSSWQPISPGMFVGMDFGKLQTVDAVVLEMAPKQDAQIRVEVAKEDGRWTPLPATMERAPFTVPSDLRRQATRSLKAHGFTHVVLREGDFPTGDVRNHADLWGLVEVSVVGPLHLYRLE
jgi:hypothetical protein